MLIPQFSSYFEAGTDDAGRGSLAGPVTAAAVILPISFDLPFLNDSKKISKSQRYHLRNLIEDQAVGFSYAHVSPNEIDKINILNASIKAMHLAFDKLNQKPEFISVDGNKFNSYKSIPFKCIIKGDKKYSNIAAASVLAKTYRDDYMDKIHEDFPDYCWLDNKGYPTKLHREAIRVHGVTPHHRKSFKLFRRQYKLNFDF